VSEEGRERSGGSEKKKERHEGCLDLFRVTGGLDLDLTVRFRDIFDESLLCMLEMPQDRNW
jgi:hypothetical protein